MIAKGTRAVLSYLQEKQDEEQEERALNSREEEEEKEEDEEESKEHNALVMKGKEIHIKLCFILLSFLR